MRLLASQCLSLSNPYGILYWENLLKLFKHFGFGLKSERTNGQAFLWSSHLYPWGVGAQGDPCAATISDLLCFPIWFLIMPDSSTGTLWKLPAETSSAKREKLGEEIAVEFCLRSISFILEGIFNMPWKPYDMRPTALLPSEGNRATDFYRT
jgi:hypothetical protein